MKRFTTLLAGVLCTALAANAVPARRGFHTLTQPDGTTVTVQKVGDEFGHYYVTTDNTPMLRDADGFLRYATADNNGNITLSSTKTGVDRTLFNKAIEKRRASKPRLRQAAASRVAAQYGMGLNGANYPRTGKVRCLVFLVQYSDVKFTLSDPSSYFKSLFNQEGFSQYGNSGSVRDYFLDQSNDRFDVTYDVYGPITLKNKRSYYGGNDLYGDDQHPEEMAAEAAEQLKSQIDFSQYDYDNDGNVDNIFVVYAGEGEATDGPEESVWPHQWEIPNGKTYNGKTLAGYCCVNEWDYNDTPASIGTFVHEFSHVMGLPDLYHTTNSYAAYTPGNWSVLDYGPYNNDGRTPPAYSAYERNAMGWLEPIVLDGPESVSLKEIQSSNTCYLIQTEKNTEFFLLENRQQTGWDIYLPGHGMLVWHVDYVPSIFQNNTVNNTASHQYVDIIEANGSADSFDLDTMAGYTFPGTKNKTSLTATTKPALQSWGGKGIDLPLTSIAEKNGIITFDVAGGNFEFGTPATPALKAADNGTITVTWSALDHATDYLLNVYTRENDKKVPFGSYTDFSTGDVTSHVIEGVQGETEYFVTIAGKAGSLVSDASAEASVTTPAINIAYTAPTALGVTLDTYGNATFTWQEHKNAHHYLLTVEYESGTGGTTTTTVDFGSAKTATFPTGWNWSASATEVYTSTGNYGKASPSLKFSKTGMCLTSEFFADPIKEVSFWIKGNQANESNVLDIEGRESETGSWSKVHSVTPSNYNKAGQTVSFTPEGSLKQIRFTYVKNGSGNAGVDDITIFCLDKSWVMHPDFKALNVGNTTHHNATLSGAPKRIRFYVTAVDAAGNTSKISNSIVTEATSEAGIVEVETADDNAPVEYFNLQGIRVVNPSNGIFIRRQGSKTSKVIL